MRIKDRRYFPRDTRGMSKWIAVAGALALGAGTLAWTRQLRQADDGTRRLAVTCVLVAPPEARVLRVAHDDIPGYMPAMTMAFTLADGESPSLAAGDRVRFTLRVGRQGTRMEGIAVTGHSAFPEVPSPALVPVARLKRGDTLPRFALVNEEGQAITDADLRGHATVVTFIFTRCPVPEFCPLVTTRFKELQAILARDRSGPSPTRLLSITLDPVFDTPDVLRTYARGIGADRDRWHFAGGNPREVERLSRAFAVHVEQNGVLLDHTLATALIDAGGRVVEIWRGNGWKASDVLAALRGGL